MTDSPDVFLVKGRGELQLSILLENTYNNYHFNESIQENSIFFDYKIKPGKANTRNAIELLRITQFPIDIYQRAQQNIRNL